MLGRHVIDRADHRSRQRQAVVVLPRQAEVEQLGLVLDSEQDIGRLDVAMDHLEAMNLAQRGGDLVDDAAQFGGRHRAALFHVVFQILADHVLHDDVPEDRRLRVVAGHVPGIECGDDVRVPQAGDHAHLGGKAQVQPGVLVGVLRPNLERDGVPHLQVLGLVDDRHAAGADFVQHAIVAQHQAVRRPAGDALGQVFRQQPEFDELVEHRLRVGQLGDGLALVGGQPLPVVLVDQAGVEQFANETVAGECFQIEIGRRFRDGTLGRCDGEGHGEYLVTAYRGRKPRD